MVLGEQLELLGQAQFIHGADLGVDDAEDEIEAQAMADDAGAEAGQARHFVAEIEALVFFERLQLHAD